MTRLTAPAPGETAGVPLPSAVACSAPRANTARGIAPQLLERLDGKSDA